MTDFQHTPVMLNEAIDFLNPSSTKVYVDCTVGGAGHSSIIAEKIAPEGKLICLDVDNDALNAAKSKLSKFDDIVTILKSSYVKLPEILKQLNIEKISGGILLDLGTSYHQLTTDERGFSFSREASLDMRFDDENPLHAGIIVNEYSEDALIAIFKDYGEERFSRRIAKKIIEKRKEKKIETTTELADIIKKAVPGYEKRINPATRVFQALRIAVNNELEVIEKAISQIIPLLEPEARIVVISFHSLEDRLVKKLFKYYSSNCRCLPEQMICSCEPAQLALLTKKPVEAALEEIKRNPPSRSAKLRAAKKI